MTLYGIGLGPGASDLITLRGKRVLESVSTVYTPGRLSRRVVSAHADDDQLADLDFPMTSDPDALRTAWIAAAETVAETARDEDAAFVTLGDPNVYSTFGHLRRTLKAFHPDVEVETVPGVSAMTAFTTPLETEIRAGESLTLQEAADGAAPTGPDRQVLFKVTDAPATYEGLTAAGYEVTFGRRLFQEEGETLVTSDPTEVTDRDYYTLAFAEWADRREEPVTAAFERSTEDREGDD
ncbi:cobalt-factor II C(20)-methyltransferase [Haloferacaceae archaeon DSL9]